MRHLLGTLVLALALASCGEAGQTDGGLQPEPAATVTQVALLTGVSAGGVVTTRPSPIADKQDAVAYAADFRNDHLQGEIVDAVAGAEVPEGQQLAAAVVAIGCEVPTKVVGTGTADVITLRAVLPPPTRECFAPITTVALVLVPS